MPQLNRDKETLYAPGRLNLWFLASSVALVGVLVAMVAMDHVRPWKATQRAFFERHAAILELRREHAEAKIRADETTRTKLAELTAAVAKAERELASQATADRLALWRGEVAELDAKLLGVDTQVKAAKSTYAERKYQYEIALHERRARDVEALAADVNRVGSEQARLERRVSELEAERKALLARIDATEQPLADLRAKRDELLKHVTLERLAAGATRDRVATSQWRNLPVLDIVAPSIKVEKVVVAHVHDQLNFATSPKVDMCMTCHRGIAEPSMSERAVAETLGWFLASRLGKKAWGALEQAPPHPDAAMNEVRAWLRVTEATPARELPRDGTLRDWLSGTPSLTDVWPEPVLHAAFGDPVDPVTGKATKTDGSKVFREQHLRGRSFADGGRDFLATFAIRRVEWAHPHLDAIVGANSPHKMDEFGCAACHHGVGRRLDFVRAAHNPGSEAQRKRWQAEHEWKPAELVEFPMLPLAYAEGQCAKCHGDGIPHRPPLVESLRREGTIRVRGKDEVGRLPAPTPVNGSLAAVVEGYVPETALLGRQAIEEHGCAGCHVITAWGAPTGYGNPEPPARPGDWTAPAPGSVTSQGVPKVGPDLKGLRFKTTKDWVARWIESPTAYRIDTRMPAFYRHVLHHGYAPVPGADGKPREETVVLEPTARDLAQIDVEVLALTTYLYDGQPLAAEDKARFEALYAPPPAGDAALGKRWFYSQNCYACHLGPDDREGSDLPRETLDRFKARDDLPPGPRLTSLGSKLSPGWLFQWLKEPRHYNSVTRMPNTRWTDQLAADGKTVVRTADQMYADVVAYLLTAKDPAFDARPIPGAGPRWSAEHDLVLADFWKEWYGKTATDASGAVRALSTTDADRIVSELLGSPNGRARVLADVGEGVVRFRGCFGCHNIAKFEDAKPIGKDLSDEGLQDLHAFDFGLLGHPYGHDVMAERGREAIDHTRWGWIEAKLSEPRVFDLARFKPRWTDKLRMPKFNFNAAERTAVTATVLGFVSKEPIQPKARYRPDADMARILAGRAVVTRYGCNQCHTIENQQGVVHAEQSARGLEGWTLPPNLYGQGNRTKAKWLFDFMKHPIDVRPGVIQRMPNFRLSDDEAAALVDYFLALAGRRDRFHTDPLDQPLSTTPYAEPVTVKAKGLDGVWKDLVVRNELEEARALFDTRNCVTCHLPRGTPGVDPSEGGSAPPLTLASKRLQHDWVLELIHNPQTQILGTKMPQNWTRKSRTQPGDSLRVEYPQFLVGARRLEKPTNDDVAHAQMEALSRYLLWHYEADAAAAGPR